MLPQARPTQTLSQRLETRQLIFQLERELADSPGAVFGDNALTPVEHLWGDGTYMRVMTMPAGVVLTGKIHRRAHPIVLLTGEVLVVTEKGGREHLRAPWYGITPAGTKRAIVALVDSTLITMHSTALRDPRAIEADLIAPTYEAFRASVEDEYRHFIVEQGLARDYADYALFLAEVGMTDAVVRAFSDNPATWGEMPENLPMLVDIRPSLRSGLGVFACKDFARGETVGLAGVLGQRTPIGRYTNHAADPNGRFSFNQEGIWLIAVQAIRAGDEITVNYRQTMACALDYQAQCGSMEGGTS